MKRITAVAIERVPDPLAGCESLGRYLDRPPPDRFYVVRETGKLKRPDGTTVAKAAGVVVGRNEFCLFVPANHVPHNPKDWSHVSAADMARVIQQHGSAEQADYHYALEDWQRAEALERCQWYYVGVRATAEVGTSTDGRFWLSQRLASLGLWGIESDSGRDYFDHIAQEELASLSGVLRELGFTRAEIAAAINTAQHQEARR